MRIRQISLLLSMLIASGCASIIDGRSQEISINTNPDGANCILSRNGDAIGSVNSTPSSIYIEKTKYDLKITCRKIGYEDATYIDHSGVQDATFGNIVLGGFIGWGIDSASGADNHYDSPVNITLSKK